MASGEVEEYQKFLKLNESGNPFEAIALGSFIPESDGIAAVDLERKIMSSLPRIAYTVSRPRQDTNLGETLLPRSDAAP